jgi:bifunctional non-homologous end joining protein LigD
MWCDVAEPPAGSPWPVSHPDRVVFPEIGLTKGALVDYYCAVADFMLPHLRGRPLMLQRFPAGIAGKGFYQKDVGRATPDWVERVEVAKQGGVVTHVVCNDVRTLAFLANQNCVTPHVWLSRADRLHNPDRLVLDLDPTLDDFDTVRDGARAIADLLREVGLVPFVQTTGSRGLHVAVPLDRSADFAAVAEFALAVADVVVAGDPSRFTTAGRKADRGDRVFIDTWRNNYAQTMAAPYSVRSRPTAPVAAPLEWDELAGNDLHAQRFTVTSVLDRLAERGDPWADIDADARSLDEPRRRLDEHRSTIG